MFASFYNYCFPFTSTSPKFNEKRFPISYGQFFCLSPLPLGEESPMATERNLDFAHLGFLNNRVHHSVY